jgi:hypothetical protein
MFLPVIRKGGERSGGALKDGHVVGEHARLLLGWLLFPRPRGTGPSPASSPRHGHRGDSERPGVALTTPHGVIK